MPYIIINFSFLLIPVLFILLCTTHSCVLQHLIYEYDDDDDNSFLKTVGVNVRLSWSAIFLQFCTDAIKN